VSIFDMAPDMPPLVDLTGRIVSGRVDGPDGEPVILFGTDADGTVTGITFRATSIRREGRINVIEGLELESISISSERHEDRTEYTVTSQYRPGVNLLRDPNLTKDQAPGPDPLDAKTVGELMDEIDKEVGRD
jgi:hypothetical protein